MKVYGCCGLKNVRDWDGLYGCCSDCAFCQSLGQCYRGEDKPENTICCHGECQRGGRKEPLTQPVSA